MGSVGRITLNRPKALNSLTSGMLSKIEVALDDWKKDEDVAAVIIDAKGDKAFCAGGDITNIYKEASRRNFQYGKLFWANEYRLNLKISKYPKPFVAFMQGFTMGGGVGISCHGSDRVVGENSIIAMPECGIGLVPDVGGSYLLARLENNLGTFLGTTATRMKAGDAIYCRFADHYVPQLYWDELIQAISKSGDVVGEINKYKQTPPTSRIKQLSSIITDTMSVPGYNEIEERMLKYSELAESLVSLRKNSPLSVAFTFEMLRRPDVSENIESALEIEYRFTFRAQEKTDFLEGIRAMVVDKDKSPRWSHKSLRDVKIDEVRALLMPIKKLH